MATIKDVASLAGVSTSTVSRVLNNSKNVSEDLRDKVMNAVNTLDFSLNDLARGLKNVTTKRIAVIFPRLSRSFFPEVLDGIHLEAEKAGYSLLIAESYDNPEKEEQLIDFFASQYVDGIILTSSLSSLRTKQAKTYIKKLSSINKKDSHIPIISLEFSLSPSIDSVVINNYQAGYDAVSYLIEERERKNIMFMRLPQESYPGSDRLEGYKDALEDHDISFDEKMILHGDFTTYSGWKEMRSAIERKCYGDAVFCANDQMAIGVIKAVLESGLSIPDDIAVIGVDDIYAASIVTPSLSSVCFPKKELGQTAMKRMSDILNQAASDSGTSQMITLPYKIIERESTNKKAKSILKNI